MRKRIAEGIAGVLILSLMFAGTACGKKSATAQAEARPLTVSAVRVEKTDMISKLTVSGKIAPVEEVKVVPKSPGRVAGVAVDVGQAVTSGDILFDLDSTDIQVRLDTARANLASSEASLEKAAAQLEKNRIQVDDAGRNLDRKKALFDSEAISQVDYETARSAYETARKDYEINAAGVSTSRAALEQSRASLRQAEVDMDNTRVRSPITGVVATRSINPGEYVSNSTAAIVVVNIATVEVNASLNEDEINNIKPGQEVDVAVAAASPSPFKGKVTKVSPYADAKNKTYPVWVAIANPDQVLKPGMFAEIQLVTRKREGILAAPSEAVVERNGQKVVYVAEGEKAAEKQVKTGASEGGRTEISEGLAEGDMLIVTGLQALRNGAPIKIQAPAGDRAAGKAGNNAGNQAAGKAGDQAGDQAAGKKPAN